MKNKVLKIKNGVLRMKNEETKMNGLRWLRTIACASLFFILHSSFSISQAQVKWHTIAEASTAKIGTKMYFIDFYTSWCGYCKKMDRETFSDPTVAKLLNKYYYPVKFNAEGSDVVKWKGQTYTGTTGQRSNAHQFASAILGKQMGFPTFVLFKSDQTVIQAIPGYYPPRDFAIILWYFASGDCDKYPYDRYQQIFDKEIRPVMEKELQ